MDRERLGIIFDGGGFTGAWSVGYMKAVEEAGLVPMYCQGVSVGALNAAKVVESEGRADALEKVWLYKIEREGAGSIFPMHQIFVRGFWSTSFFSDHGLRNLIANLDCRKVVRSSIELELVTFNEILRKQQLFGNHDPELRRRPELIGDYILASTALAGFLPPVMIKGQTHSDGLSFLIEPAIRAGCQTIFIFLNDDESNGDIGHSICFKRLLAGIHNLNDMVRDKEVAHAEDINHDLRVLAEQQETALQSLNRLRRLLIGKALDRIKFTFEGKHAVDIVVFRPPRPIPTLWTIGFQKNDIKEAIRLGHEAAKNILQEHARS